MEPTRYIVRPADGSWTIRFGQRDFDRFRSKQDAIHRALEWAVNAQRQGHQVPVLLEQEDGNTRVVEPPRPSFFWQY